MPLSLLNHSALVLFAQRICIPTLPAALASVPYGFVFVCIRLRMATWLDMVCTMSILGQYTFPMLDLCVISSAIFEL